jgi:hypothetical protein
MLAHDLSGRLDRTTNREAEEMRRSHLRFVNSVLLGLAVAGAGVGCESGPEEIPGSALQIPLTQPGAGGVIYHLNNATYVSDTAVVVPLSPGFYSVELLDGWVIERELPGAPPEELDVLLASRNPMTVPVLSEFPTYAQFQFLVGTTDGPLLLTFGVQESWVFVGNMFISTNTPSESSTGAFATLTPGTNLSMSMHFAANSTATTETATGGFARQIFAYPNTVSFFGNDHFHDVVGPAFTGTGAFFEVINNGTTPFELSPTSMWGQDGDVIYDLQITGAPDRASGSVDSDGYPEAAYLSIFPAFTMNRYENGILTDTVTGQLSLWLNAN